MSQLRQALKLSLPTQAPTSSVLEACLGASQASQHGQRVVEGQRYMQAASDIFLGWVRGEGGRDFYVRQVHDMKGGVDIDTIQPIGLTAYARGGDVVAIDAYIGADEACNEALGEFAQVYADQAERDYGQLKQAISAGKIQIQAGI